MTIELIDLFEVNKAIGTSGARIIATLLAPLQQRGGREGVASLSISGGEATAIAVELA